VVCDVLYLDFFFSSRRRHTRFSRDWSQTCALPILLIAYLLIDDEVLRFQRLLMTIQPVNVTGRIRIFKYKITIELSTLGQTQCLQIAHLLVFPSERSADTEKRVMILLCIILQAYRNLCF